LADKIFHTRTGATVTTDDAEAAHGSRAMPGDVTNDLVQLADVLGVDLVAAAHTRIDASNRRYPTDTYRDSARRAPS